MGSKFLQIVLAGEWESHLTEWEILKTRMASTSWNKDCVLMLQTAVLNKNIRNNDYVNERKK